MRTIDLRATGAALGSSTRPIDGQAWPEVINRIARGVTKQADSHFRRRLAERRATLRLSSRASRADDTPDVPSAVAVRAAVAQLPKRQRAVVVLRYFADLSVHDVSELLGLPEGTVKTLTAKALAALRASDLVDSYEVTDDA